jgi:hypothetical protein
MIGRDATDEVTRCVFHYDSALDANAHIPGSIPRRHLSS